MVKTSNKSPDPDDNFPVYNYISYYYYANIKLLIKPDKTDDTSQDQQSFHYPGSLLDKRIPQHLYPSVL